MCRAALVSLVMAWLLAAPALAVELVRPGQGLRHGLKMDFSLVLDGAPPVEGKLLLAPDGTACTRVDKPIPQEIRLDRQGMTLWYPTRGQVLRQEVPPGTLPPLLDALVVALAEVGAVLPAGSQLQQQERRSEGLVTTWQIRGPQGDPLATLQVVELRQGPVRIEVRDRDGRLQRTYAFGPRLRVGGLQVPGTIEARYLTAGKLVRTERWQLKSPEVLRSSAEVSRCARPAGKVVEVKL